MLAYRGIGFLWKNIVIIMRHIMRFVQCYQRLTFLKTNKVMTNDVVLGGKVSQGVARLHDCWLYNVAKTTNTNPSIDSSYK